MAARPVFRGERGKPSLQEAPVERGVVSDNEHSPPEQILDHSIINALTGDHLIGNAGNVRYLRRDRKAGVFEPLPGTENLVDPPFLTVIFEEANGEFDDPVTIGIGTGRLDIHHGGHELWTVIGWVVFGLRL